MAKLSFSPQARTDLDEAADYLQNVLHNPIAAQKLVRSVKKQIAMLRDYPEMGPALEDEKGITAYRRLVCGNYLAIYHIDGDAVRIDRILYGRRDYLALLFGGEMRQRDEDESE